MTSYSIARTYNIDRIAEWVNNAHAIKPKQYDECLYICYHAHGKQEYFHWGKTAYKWMTVTLAKDQSQTEIQLDPSLIDDDETIPSWMLKREVFVFDYGVVGMF